MFLVRSKVFDAAGLALKAIDVSFSYKLKFN
jgi:hypothetical protein